MLCASVIRDETARPGFFQDRAKLLLVCILCVGGLLAVACLSYVIWVVKYPGDRMSRESIERILFLESPVTYADGRTEIGVFFQEEHRRYVRYEEIPRDFINALVASEDKSILPPGGGEPRLPLKNEPKGSRRRPRKKR